MEHKEDKKRNKGGRPKKGATDKMTYRVAVKMAAADYFRLLTWAYDAGVSPSGYMRKCFHNGHIPQAGFVADLGIDALTGGECFVFLDERENVERHLSPVRSMS